MKTSVRQKIFLLSFIILAVNGILGYAVYKSNKNLNESRQWIWHSGQVINQSEKILSIAGDIETSSRGFVITNDGVFLEPFQAAKKASFINIEQLRKLTIDNAAQQQRIFFLRFYMQKRLDFSSKMIDIRSTRGLASAIAYTSTLQGKHYTDSIRQITDAIQQDENVLLKQRTQAYTYNIKVFNQFLMVVVVLIICSTILLLIIARKYLLQNKEKEKRAAELEIANEELLFQNKEKEKRALELSIANVELSFQNEEKQLRAAELLIANKELLFQNEEKENRAGELAIANNELSFQNNEKEKRASELDRANHEKEITEHQREFDRNNLNALINNTSDLMWSVDKQFNLITSNEPFNEFVSLLSGEKIIKGGSVLSDGFPPEQLIQYKNFYKRAFAGESFTEILYNARPVEIWSEISYCPIRKGNEVMGTACHSRNITEKLKAGRLLNKSEAFNRGVLNSLSSHIAVINEDGKIIAVNEAWSRFAMENGPTTLSRTALGSNYFNACEYSATNGDEVAQEALHGIKDVMDGEKSIFYLEYPCHSADKQRWFGMRAMKFESDELMIVVSHYDITERKLAEKYLFQSESRLKEAQTVAHIGNFEIDMVHYSEVWSDQMYKILGVEKSLEPTKELFSSFIHPDDLDPGRAAFRSLQNGSMDYRVIRKDGVLRYVNSEWRFEFDENNKPTRLYGILQDITERKLAELERLKMVNDLMLRNKDLEQFAYIISHNLRAPVANIIGASEALNDTDLSNADREMLSKGINISIMRLDDVVQDLNHILQVKGEIDESKEIVLFSDLVDDIKISIANLIEGHDIKIKYDFSVINEFLTLKPYLYSIFYNLITNSVKYRRPLIPCIIEIKSRLVKNKLELIFTDNGIGIDLEKKGDQVFGLYKRFHAGIEGKGMGLYMVKTQVETMGGKISIQSVVDEGSEFQIEFQI
jgi:PAS domain S-box-containing protein